jgi:hypothetical protein
VSGRVTRLHDREPRQKRAKMHSCGKEVEDIGPMDVPYPCGVGSGAVRQETSL